MNVLDLFSILLEVVFFIYKIHKYLQKLDCFKCCSRKPINQKEKEWTKLRWIFSSIHHFLCNKKKNLVNWEKILNIDGFDHNFSPFIYTHTKMLFFIINCYNIRSLMWLRISLWCPVFDLTNLYAVTDSWKRNLKKVKCVTSEAFTVHACGQWLPLKQSKWDR